MFTETQIRDRLNSGAASLNRELFFRNNVVAVNVYGERNCGKTALLEATLKQMNKDIGVGVVVGNLRAQSDTQRLAHWSDNVFMIEAFDLDASLIHERLANVDLSKIRILLIERASADPLVRYGYEDLGQSADVAVFSTSDGIQQLKRHPDRAKHSDLLVVTKADMQPYTQHEHGTLEGLLRCVNPTAPIITTSIVNGTGIETWCHWLTKLLIPITKRSISPSDVGEN